jgi:hypothetical protein
MENTQGKPLKFEKEKFDFADWLVISWFAILVVGVVAGVLIN